MAYNYEYPYVDSGRYNDDWLLNRVKQLSEDWKGFKQEIVNKIDEQFQEYIESKFDDLISKFVYDITYNEQTETISYIRKDGGE